MNSYSRLLYFVRPYYKRMIFAVFCMIVAAAAYLVVPWLIKICLCSISSLGPSF